MDGASPRTECSKLNAQRLTILAKSPSSSLMTPAKLLLVRSKNSQHRRMDWRSQPECFHSLGLEMSLFASCHNLYCNSVRNSIGCVRSRTSIERAPMFARPSRENSGSQVGGGRGRGGRDVRGKVGVRGWYDVYAKRSEPAAAQTGCVTGAIGRPSAAIRSGVPCLCSSLPPHNRQHLCHNAAAGIDSPGQGEVRAGRWRIASCTLTNDRGDIDFTPACLDPAFQWTPLSHHLCACRFYRQMESPHRLHGHACRTFWWDMTTDGDSHPTEATPLLQRNCKN